MIWEDVQQSWSRVMTHKHLVAELRQVRRLLYVVLMQIFQPDGHTYQQSSRARYLCTLCALLRIQCGLLAVMAFGCRKHINLVFRMSPFAVHLASFLVRENSNTWDPKFKSIMDPFLNALVELIFPDGSGEDDASGMVFSYTRFSTAHHKIYVGFDKVQHYAQSKWCSVIERDQRHGIETYCESSDEYFSARSRFFRSFPIDSLFLMINSMSSSLACSLREDWSLTHFTCPLQRRPKSVRAR